ncbi:hypothetical protein Bbelb_136970 [Branchiostoma belcheri]|nr:hypothetical protein Bbelb_136970 [Branchiostoma belcheri]
MLDVQNRFSPHTCGGLGSYGDGLINFDNGYASKQYTFFRNIRYTCCLHNHCSTHRERGENRRRQESSTTVSWRPTGSATGKAQHPSRSGEEKSVSLTGLISPVATSGSAAVELTGRSEVAVRLLVGTLLWSCFSLPLPDPSPLATTLRPDPAGRPIWTQIFDDIAAEQYRTILTSDKVAPPSKRSVSRGTPPFLQVISSLGGETGEEEEAGKFATVLSHGNFKR